MAPDTIVLVHGFWVTPRSWEHWITHYEAKGYRVIAPGYPGFEVEVEALRENPQIIVDVTVPAIIEKIEEVIARARQAADHHGPLGRRRLHPDPARPRLRRGGRRAQLGADRGRAGRAAVAGEVDLPGAEEPGQPAQGGRPHARAVDATRSPTPSPRRSPQALYERYHIPANGGILWGSVLANFQPGPQETWVDYHNDNRAPLLFVSGSEDHIMPPAIQQSNQKHYKSDTVTEIREYEGYAHLLPGPGGLGADRRRGPRLGRGARSLILTHVGGPTVLIEVDGCRGWRYPSTTRVGHTSPTAGPDSRTPSPRRRPTSATGSAGCRWRRRSTSRSGRGSAGRAPGARTSSAVRSLAETDKGCPLGEPIG